MVSLYLDRFANLRAGMKVLHLAPERQFFDRIASIAGGGYDPRDLQPEKYRSLAYGNIRVRKLDLCADARGLPKDAYDLILHNHVLEHLVCDYAAVLRQLHAALAPGGVHMFSIPLMRGRFEEASATGMDSEARMKKFGHPDHMRNFTFVDIGKTIGKVFRVARQVEKETPEKLFGRETLRRYNIPESRWGRFTGASLFVLKKDDLRL
jgi:phosphoglycolate phosphatase